MGAGRRNVRGDTTYTATHELDSIFGAHAFRYFPKGNNNRKKTLVASCTILRIFLASSSQSVSQPSGFNGVGVHTHLDNHLHLKLLLLLLLLPNEAVCV